RKTTLCGRSSIREAFSTGRRPDSSERSARRAALCAERTDAYVAPASTSVPNAVASAETVTQSTGGVYDRVAPATMTIARGTTIQNCRRPARLPVEARDGARRRALLFQGAGLESDCASRASGT